MHSIYSSQASEMVALIAKYQYNRAAFVAYLSVEFNVAEINANEIFYNLMDWCQAHDGECDSIVIEEEAKSSSVNMHSIPFFDGACFGGKKYFFFEKKQNKKNQKNILFLFRRSPPRCPVPAAVALGRGPAAGPSQGQSPSPVLGQALAR